MTGTPIPIIILNWNGVEDTLECLASVFAQHYRHFRVYLVDNGSHGDDAAILKEKFGSHPQVRLILNRDNLGFTRGNNRVLAELLAMEDPPPYVALLNNDTVVEPGWLGALLEAAANRQADMVSSKMVNYFDRGRMDNAGHQMLNTLEVLPIGHDEPQGRYREPFENLGPCGGAALYSLDMLRQIGLFDEHFRNGYEDVELGLRGIVCGYRAVFEPRAVVYHKISRSVNRIRDLAYTVQIQRHIYYINRKLLPWPVWLCCAPFVLFRFTAALLVNLLAFRRKFLRVQWQALRYAFTTDLGPALEARRQFFGSHRVISSWQLMHRMTFFLRHDLQRFRRYILRREKMVFERY